MGNFRYLNSKNKSIELGNSAPILITSVDGLGSPQNEIYTQKSPYQDGVTITGSTLEFRNIVLEGKIIDGNRKHRRTYRSRLLEVFNPKLDGSLIYESGDFKRKIECKVEQAPYFPGESGQNHQDFSISLIAPNPYWQDEYETSQEIITWIGGMSFPLRLPTKFSMAGPKIINVINGGDVETPIKLEIYGPATNPKITLRETGEFLRIKRILTSDDVVTITTEFGNKRVELNGENAFNILDLPSSKFFTLDVGDNVIELTTEDVNNNANVKISYRNRYIGV